MTDREAIVTMRKELVNDLNDFAEEVHALALAKGWFGVDYLGDKPEGVAVEMADCVLRILDWAGREGIDLDEILKLKHEYNKTRPYRHGGKRL